MAGRAVLTFNVPAAAEGPQKEVLTFRTRGCWDQSGGGSGLGHEHARQRVHEVLRSPGWSGRWLGVLDDLPAPSEISLFRSYMNGGAREVLTFNVPAAAEGPQKEVLTFRPPAAAEGLQGRSNLEKEMEEWFAGEGQGVKFVLWGPGGTGKSTLAVKFAAGQAEGAKFSLRAGAWPSVRLVFALSGGSMAEGYAGLVDKLQDQSGGGSGLGHEHARQRVHEVLRSPGWSGRWLGVLDDLPAPSELEKAGLGWVLTDFPWTHGRTIITTRSGEWMEDTGDSQRVTEADRRVCDKCGQSSDAMQKCEQCRKVYYCSAVCQKQAWTEHKLVCVATPLMRGVEFTESCKR